MVVRQAANGGRRKGALGYTLTEVLVASLLGSVVAGGTLMAYVTASRMLQGALHPDLAEANILAQQTIERFRNRVAADDGWLASRVPRGWRKHAISFSSGTESIRTLGAGARRCYRVRNCPPALGNCYAMQVKVCWNDLTGCPCPP